MPIPQNWRRELISIDQRHCNRLIIDGKTSINFCSNDYLGLSTEPAIQRSFIQGVQNYGFGSGSSTFIAGYFKVQRELEEALSQFLNRDKVIFFNSGYLANLGVITALARRNSRIISDRLCHASLLDGIRLSRAAHNRFRHNDVSHLQYWLQREEHLSQPSLVVTEGVFSMEGDIAPLDQIAVRVTQNKAMLIVDDAHGIGVLGEQGGGVCEYFQLSQREVPALVLPLGKAFGGIGAAVAGSHNFIDAILQTARSCRYTTALPPAICVALLKALSIVQQEQWRRQRLTHLIRFFIGQVKQRQLPLINDAITPIQSFLIPNDDFLLRVQKKMLIHGFFISCIRPPSVPIGKSRIRISLNCQHTESQIVALLDKLMSILNSEE